MKFKNYLIEKQNKALTNLYETAACMGIIISDNLMNDVIKIIKLNNKKEQAKSNITINDLEKTAKNLSKILNIDRDWNISGKNDIKKVLNNIQKKNKQFLVICGIIYGMYEFAKNKKLNGQHFIHNSIIKYYTLEKERMGEIKGSKANTADCIICNVDYKSFLKAMETEPITANKENINIGDNITYYQISLKKSFKEAQLGKIGGYMRKHFNFGLNVSTALNKINSDQEFYKNLNKDLINENIFNKIKEISKNIFDKVAKNIKKLLGKVTGKYKKIFQKKPSNDLIDELYKTLNIKKSVKEANSVTSGSLKGVTPTNQKIISTIIENPSVLIKKINKEIDNLIKISGNSTFIIYDVNKLQELSQFSENEDKILESFKLIANFCTVITIKDLLSDSENINTNMRRLLAEMFFGGTKLPLWKVYGDFGDSGKTWEFLGTIDTFVKETISDIQIETIGWKISTIKNHYTIKILVLDYITDNIKNYVLFRTGTNSSSKLTFNIEGSNTVDIPLTENLITILKGNQK